MKELIKNSSIMALTTISLMVVSVIRNKYLAVSIGPAGFGLYSLLDSFFQLVTLFTGTALATASVKYFAEFNSLNDKDSVQKVFDFSFSILFYLSIFVSVILILFFSFIKTHFLTDEVKFLHYLLFSIAYFALTISTVFNSLLRGLMLIPALSKRTIMMSVFGLITVIILVYFFSLTGFFINVLISAFFGLFLFWIEGRKWIKVRLKMPSIRDQISLKMIKFSGTDIFMGLTYLLVMYLLRLAIVNNLSMAALGIFAAANSINQYLAIGSTSAQYYSFTKMSENLDLNERNKTLNDYLRLTIVFGLVTSVFMILVGPIFIRILYSKEFLDLVPILFYFVISQLIQSIQLGYTFNIVGQAKLKLLTITNTLGSLIYLIIPLIFIKKIGLISLALGLAFGSLSTIVVLAPYLKSNFKVQMSRKNLLYLFITSLLILVSILIRDTSIIYKILVFGISLFVAILNITKEERGKGLAYVSNRLQSLRRIDNISS